MTIAQIQSNGISTAMLNAQKATPAKPDPSRGVDAAAKEFEGVFISEMLSHVFGDEKPDAVFDGGHGEEMFKSMLINEYGKKMAEGKGIGLSSQIKSMMIQMQQKANGGTI